MDKDEQIESLLKETASLIRCEEKYLTEDYDYRSLRATLETTRSLTRREKVRDPTKHEPRPISLQQYHIVESAYIDQSESFHGGYTDDQLRLPLPFHPTQSPRGTEFYAGAVLNAGQQRSLNIFKESAIKDNNKYLAQHPEVRALVSLLLQHILKKGTHCLSIGVEAAEYFSRARMDIETDIEEYLIARGEPLKKEADSNVQSEVSISSELARHGKLKDYSYTTYSEGSVSLEIPAPEEEEEMERISEKDVIVKELIYSMLDTATASRKRRPPSIGLTWFDDEPYSETAFDVAHEMTEEIFDHVFDAEGYITGYNFDYEVTDFGVDEFITDEFLATGVTLTTLPEEESVEATIEKIPTKIFIDDLSDGEKSPIKSVAFDVDPPTYV